MNILHKTIVITGGSDGLGFALAQECISHGANVCIIGKTQEKIDKAVRALGPQARGFLADVSKYEELEIVAKAIGSVDALINAAGIWLEGDLETNTSVEIAYLLDVNLRGVVYATKAFLPALKRAEQTYLINISSTSGLRGRENQPIYAASKFGVTGFTESLKLDLANTNVVVCGFYPGGMRTKLFAKAGTPKDNEDWMDPKKVAEILVFMIERDASLVMDHVVVNKRKTKTTNN